MKRVILLFIACIFSFISYSQTITYAFRDSTKVDAHVVSTRPENVRQGSLYIGALGPEPLNFIGVSLTNPRKFYINAMGGLFGGMIEGNVFLTSKLKESTLKQRVLTIGEVSYVIKLPIEKRISFGPHFGTSYYNYIFNDPFSAVGIITGLSIVKSKHANWFFNKSDKARRTTRITRFNADVVFYVNRKGIDTAENPVDLDKYSRRIGYRVYIDGKTSGGWHSDRLTLNYMLGLGVTGQMNALPLLAGIGLGYNFF